MKIVFKQGVCLSVGRCQKQNSVLKFKCLSSKSQKALEALIDGCEETDLANIVGDSDELVYFYFCIEALKKNSFLQYRTAFLDLIPFNGAFVLQNDIQGAFFLSRFTLCRMDQNSMILESPLSGSRALLTQNGWSLIHALREPITVKEAIKKFPQFAYKEIYETFCLLVSGSFITSEVQETASMAHWEFHDLFFHSRSRSGRTDQLFGGTFRFRGKYVPLAAIKSCEHSSWVSLDRPAEPLQISFEQALDQRKSIRENGSPPITIKQLGEFLWRCARIKEVSQTNDEEFTMRPYPSGGARYALEIYLIIPTCDGISPGVYHYHPLEHRLGKISEINQDASQMLLNAKGATSKKEDPQVLFQISARFQRVFWKYQSIGYALILKDVGSLIQTMYLVASAMQLAPCAVGAGDSDLFCKLIGTAYLEETSVGEFILGSL